MENVKMCYKGVQFCWNMGCLCTWHLILMLTSRNIWSSSFVFKVNNFFYCLVILLWIFLYPSLQVVQHSKNFFLSLLNKNFFFFGCILYHCWCRTGQYEKSIAVSRSTFAAVFLSCTLQQHSDLYSLFKTFHVGSVIF